MLRDITTTSARVNSDIIPCIRPKYNKPQKSRSDKKRVQFDADGAPSFVSMLTVAMKGEKRQKKKAKLSGVSTPKKKKPEKSEIGSSSTWNHDQLDLYKVHPSAEVEAKDIIPEKWFDFSNLENYHSGNNLPTIRTDFSSQQLSVCSTS
jgi:hypothetical protein